MAVDNGGPHSMIRFSLGYVSTLIGTLSLSKGPKSYQRYSTVFKYTKYTPETVLFATFTGDTDNGRNEVSVVLDNFSIINSTRPT
jgi:hypothetical protein